MLLSGITAALLLAHVISQLGIYSFGADKHWLDALNMDRELNLPTLFSTGLMLLIAVLLHRLQTTNGSESPSDWRLLSRIFVFLALDEALQIHEILIFPGLRHHIHPALASTWVIPYGLLVLVLLWRFRTFLRTLPAEFASRALQAGAVYVGGTIGMEMVGSFAVRSELEGIVLEVTQAVNREAAALNQRDRDRILASGSSKLISLTPEQRQAWREKMMPVWQRYEADIGADVIRAALTVNRKH